ncbi:hypothetical protein DdX_16198 [Ditylenchus destructor]|uniref:Uncharacterized protein n=1 Tax=Ditylenchus destructor TaxID=166010 RepID=A0AAD4MPD9_9BILA|nr:hypothetical protein DdX_16198 [Ditylenchus destructor]
MNNPYYENRPYDPHPFEIKQPLPSREEYAPSYDPQIRQSSPLPPVGYQRGTIVSSRQAESSRRMVIICFGIGGFLFLVCLAVIFWGFTRSLYPTRDDRFYYSHYNPGYNSGK